MRSWRSEILSMVTVLAIPVVIALVFPYSALNFKAGVPTVPQGPEVCFVQLSPELELQAVNSAKTSWRGAEGDYSHIELKLGELPQPDVTPVLNLSSRGLPPTAPLPQERLPGYLPSQAAADPVPLAAEAPTKSAPAFSRDELLEIH